MSRQPANTAPTLPGETPEAAFKRLVGPEQKAKRHKFSAQRTKGYASKLEAEQAEELATLKRAGMILGWLEQVPVILPGRVRYLIDFMVINRDGTVRFIECKGVDTRVWINKHRQLQELHPEIFSRLEVRR